MVEINRILLVDDDPNIRKLATMSLERVGHWKVIAVSSGQESLDVISQVKPDVVLLDVMMPGLDGRSTLARLKNSEDNAHVPVILMTAKVQLEEVEEYLNLGAVGVLIKPFDPMSLPKEIREMLERSCKAQLRN